MGGYKWCDELEFLPLVHTIDYMNWGNAKKIKKTLLKINAKVEEVIPRKFINFFFWGSQTKKKFPANNRIVITNTNNCSSQ